MRCAFSESTVPSDVPWKMIIGGIGATATMGGAVVLPRMARMALVGLDADRYGGAECTPTAANISGYVAASTTAIAPPAERPVTYIRSGRHATPRFRLPPGARSRRELPVRPAEPVPAPLWVVRRGLFRIHHDESVLVGQLVQPRAGGEIHRRLCAPMQGEQQRSAGGAAQPERDVYAVTPGTSQAGVAKLTPRAAPGPAVFRRLLPCRIGRGPCPLDGGLSGPGLGGSREHLDGKDLDARSRRPALARPCRARDERLHEGGPGRPARSSSWHVILPLSGTAGDERGFPATDHRRCGPPDGTGVRRMAGRPTSLATPGSRLAHPRRDLSGKGGAEPPGVCDAPESVSDVCECPRSGYGNDIGPA